jgi:hypothetical protein
MEISWAHRAESEEVLQRVKGERASYYKKQRKANWIDRILLRSCLLKHVIEGMVEGTGGRGRKLRQMLDNLKEMRCWKLKQEALGRTAWITLGRGYTPVVKTTWL